MKTTYNHESLDRHGISEEEADEVYATGKDFDLSPSDDGHDRIMVVGWTATGRLLEVGIEFLPGGDEHIFHANLATKHYEKLFEKDTR
jgi:hypothetical protein